MYSMYPLLTEYLAMEEYRESISIHLNIAHRKRLNVAIFKNKLTSTASFPTPLALIISPFSVDSC